MFALKYRKRRLAHSGANGTAFALIAGIIWGTIGVVGKHLLARHTPVTILTFRLLIAAVLGQVILFVRYRGFRKPASLGSFILHGIVGIAFTQLLYFQGVARIGVGMTVALHYTWPSFALAFGGILFGERIDGKKITALLCTVVGVGMVSLSGKGELFIANFSGIAMAILSGLTLAASSVFAKSELKTHEPFEVIVWPLTFAALFMAGYAVLTRALAVPFSIQDLALTAYLGIFTNLIADVLLIAALKVLPVGEASIMTTVEPIVAILLARVMLSEVLNRGQVVGVFLILVGVVLTYLERKKPDSEHQAALLLRQEDYSGFAGRGKVSFGRSMNMEGPIQLGGSDVEAALSDKRSWFCEEIDEEQVTHV